jgi:hypothetical protein
VTTETPVAKPKSDKKSRRPGRKGLNTPNPAGYSKAFIQSMRVSARENRAYWHQNRVKAQQLARATRVRHDSTPDVVAVPTLAAKSVSTTPALASGTQPVTAQ